MHGRLTAAAAILLGVLTYAATFGMWWGVGQVWMELRSAPVLSSLNAGPYPTIVLDRHGKALFTFYTEQRLEVPLKRVSRHMVNAALAAEDRRFFWHHGVDVVRLAAAAVTNVRAGGIEEGGSTITQQLVRVTSLTPERTFARKLREVVLAGETESRYSKLEILEAYLNQVYLGGGYYGVETAARGYFQKPAADLNAAEAALLAGLIRAPSALAPSLGSVKPATVERRNVVLRAMYEHGMLAGSEYREAVAADIRVARRRDVLHQHDHAKEGGLCGLYFKEHIRDALVARFGEDRVDEGGLRVHSTLDAQMQRAAEDAISKRTRQIRIRAGKDLDLQGSLVAIDPRTGEVLAMVGGRDFHESSYNRATQARRQPGSAFKPLIFAAALERGYGPATLLTGLSEPIRTPEREWTPGGEHEAEEYTLRRALKVSSNRAAAQLLQRVGMSSVLDLSKRMGIQTDLPAVPSLALGTGEVTLLELTAAYSAFANGGLLVRPITIQRVEARDGSVLWKPAEERARVLRQETAFLMSNMMADVVDTGTGATARSLGFQLPAAGKTGTTNDYTDAWFIGYTPKVIAGVWFGSDEPTKIMNRGFAGIVAVPAWTEFMRAATRGDRPMWFTPPNTLERVAICRLTGLRAVPGCRNASATQFDDMGRVVSIAGGVVDEYFLVGTAPTSTCYIHSEEGMQYASTYEPLWDPLEPIGTGGEVELLPLPEGGSLPELGEPPATAEAGVPGSHEGATDATPDVMTDEAEPAPVIGVPAETNPAPAPVEAPAPNPEAVPPPPASAPGALPPPPTPAKPAPQQPGGGTEVPPAGMSRPPSQKLPPLPPAKAPRTAPPQQLPPLPPPPEKPPFP